MKLILLCAVCFTGTLLVQSKTVEFQQDIDAPEETIDNLDVFLSESEDSEALWVDDGDSASVDDVGSEVDDVIDEAYQVEGCGGGKCEVCFKVWKIRGCFIAKLASDGIKLSIEINGSEMYSKVFSASRTYKIKIRKSRLPKFLRKMLKSDIEVTISGINLKEKKVCVQLKAKVKWIGTVRWPRRRPHCFKL